MDVIDINFGKVKGMDNSIIYRLREAYIRNNTYLVMRSALLRGFFKIFLPHTAMFETGKRCPSIDFESIIIPIYFEAIFFRIVSYRNEVILYLSLYYLQNIGLEVSLLYACSCCK